MPDHPPFTPTTREHVGFRSGRIGPFRGVRYERQKNTPGAETGRYNGSGIYARRSVRFPRRTPRRFRTSLSSELSVLEQKVHPGGL